MPSYIRIFLMVETLFQKSFKVFFIFPEITGSPSESPIVVPCKQPPISYLFLFTKPLKYEMGPS